MTWYVMKSKYKREFYAQNFFNDLNIDSYVPFFEHYNGKSKNKKVAVPGYIFVSLKKFEYKILYTGHQLILKKLKSSNFII